MLKFLFPLFCFYSLANAGHALELTPHQVEISSVRYKGLEAIRVMESAVSTDEDKIAIITKTQMTNGVISGCVAGDVGAKFSVGHGGMTPYRRPKGKDCRDERV